MNKKTIIIVSIAVVFALFAIAVIATFPTYIFEEIPPMIDDTVSNSGNIVDDKLPPVQGDDQGILGGDNDSHSANSTLPLTELQTFAKKDGVKIAAEEGAFPKGTEFEIEKLRTGNKQFYRARYAVKSYTKKQTIFDITASADGKSVKPDGVATIYFDIPDNYDLDKVALYYVYSDLTVRKLSASLDKDNRVISAPLSDWGIYIVAENKKATSNTIVTPSEEATTSGTSSDSSTSSEAPTTSSGDSTTSTDSSESSSSGTSSDIGGSDTPAPQPDPNQDTMDGWSPWY